MEIDLNINDIFSLLQESYRNIDFRSVLYKKYNNWNRIISIFRFSNDSESLINEKHQTLEINKYKTDNFEIQNEIFEVSKWEEKLVLLYSELHEEIELYDLDEIFYNDAKYNGYKSSFLDQFKAIAPKSSMRFYLTEEEHKKYNTITFFYGVENLTEHHNNFYFLNEEILTFGEDNIYDIINRTMELDGYSIQSRLNIMLVFPIYLNIKDLEYNDDILTGNIRFHEIYEGTKLFFRMYSNPNYNKDSFETQKEAVITKDDSKTIEKDKRCFEMKFNLDFSKWYCDPNFEIRALWDKLPRFHLLDFLKSFRPKNQKEIDFTRREGKKFIQELHITSENKYIKIEFEKYSLPEFDDFKNLINKSYREKDLYKILPILLRCLFENLLHYIFMHGLCDAYSYFYFNDKSKQVRNFYTLIELLKVLKDADFKQYCNISPNTIILLERLRKLGNYTVHEILESVTLNELDHLKGEIKNALKSLLVLYKNIKNQNVAIKEKNSIGQIHKIIGIQEKKRADSKTKIGIKQKKKVKDNEQDDIKNHVKNLLDKIKEFIKYIGSDGYIQNTKRRDEMVNYFLKHFEDDIKDYRKFFELVLYNGDLKKYNKKITFLKGEYIITFRNHHPYTSEIRKKGSFQGFPLLEAHKLIDSLINDLDSHLKENFEL